MKLEEIKAALANIAGSENVFAPDRAEYYAYLFGDATMYRSRPDVVVYPGSADEIQQIIKFAKENGIKVTPGAGLTGLSGGAVCDGGILLHPSRLRKGVGGSVLGRTSLTT